MWMSDKPLVQLELAESISTLVLAHSNLDNAFMFQRTFYKTFQDELGGIDRYRYDSKKKGTSRT